MGGCCLFEVVRWFFEQVLVRFALLQPAAWRGFVREMVEVGIVGVVLRPVVGAPGHSLGLLDVVVVQPILFGLPAISKVDTQGAGGVAGEVLTYGFAASGLLRMFDVGLGVVVMPGASKILEVG